MTDKQTAVSSFTAEELKEAGLNNLPDALVSGKHLIYSSPAALAFNSPGAEGFGVKRAALAIPGSVMLLVSPGCCGRNTSLISRIPGYANRFFYLTMNETDIVTGRHLKKIPKAVEEVYNSLANKPSVIMICITCVDALLGTDMERVCRMAEQHVPIPVRPSYMYALTREGRKPPMVHVRQSLYSLLEPMKKRGTSVNLLGFFAPLVKDCELYDLLRDIGVKRIREISTCETYEEFLMMAEANFNLVLNPEARYAAEDLQKNLKIPSIELKRLYDIDRIHRQYQALGAALGVQIRDESYYDSAEKAVRTFKERYGTPVFSIGECMNGDPFELAAALVGYGFSVKEIFGTVTADNFFFVEQLAKVSPQTKVYSNLEPTMIAYDPDAAEVDITIGKDAGYYHQDRPCLNWNGDIQPFGYAAVQRLFAALEEVLSGTSPKETVLKTTEFSLLPEQEIASTMSNHAFRKYLTPFAPDQSGAVGVLFELGGIQVICDAGGCVGNICGFDEPRWFEQRSAIFSAGLRDMDAILGRDDQLVAKLTDAAEKISPDFAAVIGTPVPAVIATDYHALRRMAEKKTKLPILAVETNGMDLYDEGEKKAYLELFSAFAGMPEQEKEAAGEEEGKAAAVPVEKGRIGVLGVTPLNYSDCMAGDRIRRSLAEQGWKTVDTYGMGSGLERVKSAHLAEKNLVAAPSGLAAAEYLKRKFGTPFELEDPLAEELLDRSLKQLKEKAEYENKKILIVSQQVTGASMRKILKERGAEQVVLATFFMRLKELAEEGDLRLQGERQFVEAVREGAYDWIIADEELHVLVPDYEGTWMDLPQFAVTGRMM